MSPITLSDIQAAAERLAGHIVRTPLLESPALSAAAGCRLLVKAEVLQRTGAFKIRGALNKMMSLPPEKRSRGVVRPPRAITAMRSPPPPRCSGSRRRS